MQRDYQLGIVITPDAGDEQARTIVERITQVVANSDGQVVRVDAWGRKRLAYPIERHRDGLYFWFDLILPPTAVAELERTLRVNEDIIRHLVTLRDARVVTETRRREAELDAQQAVREAEAAAARERGAAAATATAVAEESPAPVAAVPEAEPATSAAAEAEDEADEADEAQVEPSDAEAEV